MAHGTIGGVVVWAAPHLPRLFLMLCPRLQVPQESFAFAFVVDGLRLAALDEATAPAGAMPVGWDTVNIAPSLHDIMTSGSAFAARHALDHKHTGLAPRIPSYIPPKISEAWTFENSLFARYRLDDATTFHKAVTNDWKQSKVCVQRCVSCTVGSLWSVWSQAGCFLLSMLRSQTD